MIETIEQSTEGLLSIQQKLKANKDKTNSFGKYNYRNAESILESLKPLLKEVNAVIIINEEIISMADHNVIKSTANFLDDKGNTFKASAFAGVDINRKGMDIAQSYGASSSYAKKYALCNLFAIDDSTNDPDSKQPPSDDKQRKELEANFSKLAKESGNDKAIECISQLDTFNDSQLLGMIKKLKQGK